ncbi:hypothetical protein Plhal710r2_c034g0125461 [Plasmopara halstedii]
MPNVCTTHRRQNLLYRHAYMEEGHLVICSHRIRPRLRVTNNRSSNERRSVCMLSLTFARGLESVSSTRKCFTLAHFYFGSTMSFYFWIIFTSVLQEAFSFGAEYSAAMIPADQSPQS